MPRTKTTRNPFGSIFPRKLKRDGRTIVVYDARKRYRDQEGKPAEKFRRCLSHGEAMVALGKFQDEIERERLETTKDAVPVPHSFFELTDYFEATYVQKPIFVGGVQISGYRKNLTHIATIIKEQKDFFGNKPLPSIAYEDLRNFHIFVSTQLTKRRRKPSMSTVNEKMSFLRRVFSIALQLGWLEMSPFKRGPRLIYRSAETRRNRMLTYDEEARLLAACTGRRTHLRSWIIATLDTAMRRGDIYALRWKDVDLENRVIYIERREVEDDPRSKTGIAGILPITPRLFEVLAQLRSVSPFAQGDDLVFGKIDYKRAFNSACVAASIDNLQFRDLRSTASTRMLLAGNSNALVRKITRHTDDTILIANYTNVDIENARLIGEKLAEFNEFQSAKVNGKENDQKAA